MNLSQLEILVAIIDSGSLTEASERIGISQSAVSHALSKLEKELGVVLLERNRNGVIPTHIGKEIVQHARHILIQSELIRQKTAHERGLSLGKLRFGCVPNMPSRMFTGLIRDFQHKYPNIEFVLFEGNPQELVSWLNQQIIDVATVSNPQDYRVHIPLAQIEAKIIVSENHPLAHQQDVTLNDIFAEALIAPKAEYQTFVNLVQSKGSLPRLRYEVSSYQTIFAMLRENMGITIMPHLLIETPLEGLRILSLNPSIFLNIYLASYVSSPVIEAFLRNAQRWVKEQYT